MKITKKTNIEINENKYGQRSCPLTIATQLCKRHEDFLKEDSNNKIFDLKSYLLLSFIFRKDHFNEFYLIL